VIDPAETRQKVASPASAMLRTKREELPRRKHGNMPAVTEEEAVAIVAAVEALWPRPVVSAAPPMSRRASWRFSGRWWSVPLPVRRDRPWH
jgi:hypothetical protein